MSNQKSDTAKQAQSVLKGAMDTTVGATLKVKEQLGKLKEEYSSEAKQKECTERFDDTAASANKGVQKAIGKVKQQANQASQSMESKEPSQGGPAQ